MDPTLTPAYGRDYRSAKAVRDAFEGGEDFRASTGGYVNREDAHAAGLREVTVRYAGLRKVVRVRVTP